MDTGTVIKINNLAKELVQKGLSPSFEDASKMAQKIMKEEIIPKVPKEGNPIEKYEILLERTNRKISNELNYLKEQISSITNELTFIKEDLKRLKLDRKEIKKEVKEKKEEKSFTNKPEDIAIDKIFYCGKK